MEVALVSAFAEFGKILGVCPCCGDLFYLADARPYVDGQRPQSMLDDLERAEQRLEQQAARLAENEAQLRELSRRAGLLRAKKLLKKIDPHFSGSGYDPQDVKVIFDPIEYVVFDGMGKEKLKGVRLLSRRAYDRRSERVQTSITRAIKAGNVEFRTLRVSREGVLAEDH